MAKKLDPILHNELRLSILSLLISLDQADFNYLLEKTEASKGNLSVQLSKLKEIGYIEINKSFRNNYPYTECKISSKGIAAFEKYVAEISKLLNINK